MSEVDLECQECDRRYPKLLKKYRKLKKQCRGMRKSFAAVECAITLRRGRYEEFIIGECEAYRGKSEPGCPNQCL